MHLAWWYNCSGGITMAVTRDDLRDFTIYAGDKLHNGGADSLVELAREWEANRGSREMSPNVEIDANTAKWLAECFPDMHDDERLQRALARRSGVTTAQLLSNAALAANKADRE
jgi:hypothetical protein